MFSELRGPKSFFHMMSPVEISNVSKSVMLGKVTYRRPLFPGVIKNDLSISLKSLIHLKFGLRVYTEYNCPSLVEIYTMKKHTLNWILRSLKSIQATKIWRHWQG